MSEGVLGIAAHLVLEVLRTLTPVLRAEVVNVISSSGCQRAVVRPADREGHAIEHCIASRSTLGCVLHRQGRQIILRHADEADELVSAASGSLQEVAQLDGSVVQRLAISVCDSRCGARAGEERGQPVGRCFRAREVVVGRSSQDFTHDRVVDGRCCVQGFECSVDRKRIDLYADQMVASEEKGRHRRLIFREDSLYRSKPRAGERRRDHVQARLADDVRDLIVGSAEESPEQLYRQRDPRLARKQQIPALTGSVEGVGQIDPIAVLAHQPLRHMPIQRMGRNVESCRSAE